MDAHPQLTAAGNARFVRKFDERGNEIETSFFGIHGKPVMNVYRIHRSTAAYDTFGNEIDSARFGVSGEPILNHSGYHREETIFDGRGHKMEQKWFGVDGTAVINTNKDFGAASCTWSSNDRGQITETRRFGLDGALINGAGGWTR